jgi:protein-disulfide isomerase
MTSNIYGSPVPPKKDRREHARETAKLERDALQKKEQRKRFLVRGGVGVGLLAAAAIVALIIVNSVQPPVAGPQNMASDGIVLTGDGTTITAEPSPSVASGADQIPTDTSTLDSLVDIVIYVDYLCPVCGTFEATNAAQIESWVTAGEASLEVHPIAILNQLSAGTEYPTRAAGAAACVADIEPDKFFAVNAALFSQQPTENTPGLSNDELITLTEDAGVTDPQVATCITEGTFTDWADAATARALAGPIPNSELDKVSGTPTAIVNGVQYPGAVDDAAAFAQFVASQAAAAVTPSATPTP